MVPLCKSCKPLIRTEQRWEEDIPVASTRAVLLDLLGINICETMLGKVTRKMLGRSGGAFSEALVVTIVGLVRSSHCKSQR